jgi:hypothetical protein
MSTKLYLDIPLRGKEGKLNRILNIYNGLIAMNQIADSSYSNIKIVGSFKQKLKDITSIGLESVNGIIFKADIGDDKNLTCVIKTDVSSTADPLDYEYHIQSILNNLRLDIPNFSLAFGIFKCIPSNDTLSVRKLKAKSNSDKINRTEKEEIFKELKRNYGKIKNICQVPTEKNMDIDPFIFTVSEFVENPISLLDFCEYKAKNIDDVIDVLLQVTCALQVAQDKYKFTHYDIHPGNVLLKPLEKLDKFEKGMKPLFCYKLGKKNLPYYFIRTNYVAIIIDFGRSYIANKRMYFDDSDTSPNFAPFGKMFKITPNKFNPLWDIARVWGSSLKICKYNKNISASGKYKAIVTEIHTLFDMGRYSYLGRYPNMNINSPADLIEHLHTLRYGGILNKKDMIANPISGIDVVDFNYEKTKKYPLYMFNAESNGKYTGNVEKIRDYIKDMKIRKPRDIKNFLMESAKLQLGGSKKKKFINTTTKSFNKKYQQIMKDFDKEYKTMNRSNIMKM